MNAPIRLLTREKRTHTARRKVHPMGNTLKIDSLICATYGAYRTITEMIVRRSALRLITAVIFQSSCYNAIWNETCMAASGT